MKSRNSMRTTSVLYIFYHSKFNKSEAMADNANQKQRNCFKNEFSKFVLFFQLLSCFPYSPNPIFGLILKFLSLANILGVCWIAVSGYHHNLYIANSISMQISMFVLFGQLFTRILNVVQTGLTSKKQREIYRKLDDIDSIFEQKLSAKVNYEKCKIRLYLKYLFIIVTFIAFRVLAFEFCDYNTPYYLHLMLPQFFNQMRCLQIIFYADLMNEKVKMMNRQLAAIANNDRDHSISFIVASRDTFEIDSVHNNKIEEEIMNLKLIQSNCYLMI